MESLVDRIKNFLKEYAESSTDEVKIDIEAIIEEIDAIEYCASFEEIALTLKNFFKLHNKYNGCKIIASEFEVELVKVKESL
jgi:hypothetical protein